MGVSAQKRSRRSEVIVTAFSKISKFPQTPQNKHHLRTNHLPQRSLPNMPHNSNGAPPSLPHCSAKSSWRARIWYPTFPFFTFSQPQRWQAAGLKPSTFWRAPQVNTAESPCPADITVGFTSLSGGTVLAALGGYGIWKQAGSFAFSIPNVLRKQRG